MQKLSHLSKTLLALHHPLEASLIQKLAREYMETVSREGLSSKFYTVARTIESDLYNWRRETIQGLKQSFYKKYPDLASGIISNAINSCFYEWTASYSSSIGSSDSNIPPWLFGFLESKVFPLIKESFMEAIEELPADSETKSGLQEYVNATTLNQLGVSNLSDLLDGGMELWSTSIANLVHEIHHNILNHSAWKRFSTLGTQVSNYNLLDAMEEGFAITLQSLYQTKDLEIMHKELAEGISDFLLPILKRVVLAKVDPALIRERRPGFFILENWSAIDDHLDKIAGEEMGVKLSATKILFLKEVLSILKSNIVAYSSWDDIRRSLISAVYQVWSNPISEDSNTHWDFLTGDDELLLINLMRSLDSKADLFWSLWEESKAIHFAAATSALSDCIRLHLSQPEALELE